MRLLSTQSDTHFLFPNMIPRKVFEGTPCQLFDFGSIELAILLIENRSARLVVPCVPMWKHRRQLLHRTAQYFDRCHRHKVVHSLILPPLNVACHVQNCFLGLYHTIYITYIFSRYVLGSLDKPESHWLANNATKSMLDANCFYSTSKHLFDYQ